MQESLDRKNTIAMKLLHYFITEKNYNPIILQGAEDEIWLENLKSDYKVVRIVSNHIHNDEQLDFDLRRTKRVLNQIKKKTFSLNIKVLSIFTDVDDDVDVENVKNIDCVSLYDESDLNKYRFVYDVFPDIDEKMKFTEEGFQLFMKITADINRKNKDDAVKVDEVFKPKVPYVTYTLIGINLLVFIIMFLFNQYDLFVNEYAVYGPSIVINHEFYRLITGTFLHGDIFHFLFNMYALYVVGPIIEKYYGKGKFLLIYLGSGIIGSLFSVVLTNYASVGASGAIFGLFGALLYFGYKYRATLDGFLRSSIIPTLLVNLLLGFMIPGIDVSAHLGGLIGGLLFSYQTGVVNKEKTKDKINGLIIILILIAFLIFMLIKKQ